ncbi:hypothetical protein B0T17DRAFT_617336 [Bombardia bombarda]|uniref:Uncharacterized protein n=1 Tax=Bombardia bombarda TaxID=252184 RepID=A0AA40C5A9_9PEZI|nr:hypothetical protein B0T17DRAFT_617336 [Bombardia bombarda]
MLTGASSAEGTAIPAPIRAGGTSLPFTALSRGAKERRRQNRDAHEVFSDSTAFMSVDNHLGYRPDLIALGGVMIATGELDRLTFRANDIIQRRVSDHNPVSPERLESEIECIYERTKYPFESAKWTVCSFCAIQYPYFWSKHADITHCHPGLLWSDSSHKAGKTEPFV